MTADRQVWNGNLPLEQEKDPIYSNDPEEKGERLPGSLPIGRLAPSPTGVLHLGNARSFLIAWLSIRQQGGRILLRIEDLDGPRVRKGATEAAIEDLQWLGLDWDGEVLIQSHFRERHDQALEDLVSRGLAYPCTCTRSEIESAASAPHESNLPSSETVYPGTCRDRWSSVEEARRVSGREAAIRLRLEGSPIPFEDRFRGSEPGHLEGDFVLRKRDGTPSYQLAVVADDAADGITEVIRADDLIPSTPRQLLLYRLFGWQPPSFAHLPLLVGPDGLRLAKRHGDTSLAHYRSQGVTPDEVVGTLASLRGLVGPGLKRMPEDLIDDFDLGRIGKDPLIWDGTRQVPGRD